MTAMGSRIIVLGAGVCGLAAGMLLRRDGHDVTILERDPGLAAGGMGALDACLGVTQFRQPHYLQSRGRIMLEEELPDIFGALGGRRRAAVRSAVSDAADDH